MQEVEFRKERNVMKIKAIMPDKAMDRETLDLREAMLAKLLSPEVEISVDCIKKGPDELDCNTDEAFAAGEIVRECIKAEKEGFDAIVIYCFSDVGIDAVRENVSIPVIGPGETTLAIANMLFNRFSVITTESSNIARTYRRLMRNGIAREKMTSVRALDIPIGELREDSEATQKYLLKICEEAVAEDHVDGIILGCLGMAQYGEAIEAQCPVKVLDPAFIAIAYAEMCVRVGLTHCESVYPKFQNHQQVGL